MKNLSKDIKVMEIKRVLKSRIVEIYIDNAQAMKKSLDNLEIELKGLTEDEIIERYEYILEGESRQFDGETFGVVRYGRKMYIIVSLYEKGRKLDMRSKKVKEYKREGFTYNKNTRQFEKVAMV